MPRKWDSPKVCQTLQNLKEHEPAKVLASTKKKKTLSWSIQEHCLGRIGKEDALGVALRKHINIYDFTVLSRE